MKREVLTCDVCERELPLRGIKGQIIREVKNTWHWPSFKPEPWKPDHICCECWDAMLVAAREIRAEIETVERATANA